MGILKRIFSGKNPRHFVRRSTRADSNRRRLINSIIETIDNAGTVDEARSLFRRYAEDDYLWSLMDQAVREDSARQNTRVLVRQYFGQRTGGLSDI